MPSKHSGNLSCTPTTWFTPIFNIPSSVAVSLPSIAGPFPFITKNSASIGSSPFSATCVENFPSNSNGFSDPYANNFVSVFCDWHQIFFPFSSSHNLLSFIFTEAPLSTITSTSNLSTMIGIVSYLQLLVMCALNANSSSYS